MMNHVSLNIIGLQLGIGLMVLGQAGAGEPAAQLARMKATILETIATNNHQAIYDTYRTYTGKLLDQSSGRKRWNDKNALFRLTLIDRWLRDPLAAPGEGEALTRLLHQSATNPAQLGLLLGQCVKLLDLPPGAAIPRNSFRSPEEALRELETRLAAARKLTAEALQGLNNEELELLQRQSGQLLASSNDDGGAHTIAEEKEGEGNNLLKLLARVDLKPMLPAAAMLLDLLEDREFMERLAKLAPQRCGTILIGGPADDTYNLAELKDVECLIEPAGNDTYLEGSTSAARPVLQVIDFKGDDRYIAQQSFAQGSGHFGVSLLYDVEGDDRYTALNASQGCGFVGVGWLIDGAGNDAYTGDTRVQGSALYGIGVLIDRGGNDTYSAALYAQGYGGALGVGLLEDSAGQDHYQAGGKYDDGYREPPHCYKEAFSQGCGSGLRGFCNGGCGVLLDGGGDDLYEADFFSSGGYWFAAGLSRDFGGNDVRRPLTKNFSRYGLGYGCHYGVGLIFDDSGNDQYLGGRGVEGFGWDIALGGLFDFDGSDLYSVTASGQGHGREMSWGILYDGNGSDQYQGVATNGINGQGFAWKVKYHPEFNGAGNFSFLIDAGKGQDEFSCGAKLNAATYRGTNGGVGYVIHH